MYAVLMISAFAIVALARSLSVPWEAAYGAGNVFLFTAVLILESIKPFRRSWAKADGQTGADLFHLGGSLVAARAGRLCVDTGLAAVGIHLAAPTSSTLISWPFSLRLLLALLIVEAARYLHHRLEHRLAWLWRFHRLHHDSRRLTVLKSGRGHVLMFLLQSLVTVGPILMLGLGEDVLVWCVCAQGFVGILAHANVDMPVGALGWLIPGPDAHRLHHARSSDVDTRAVNLGAATLLFDHLFGTFRKPDAKGTVIAVGILDETPTGIVGQLLLRDRSPDEILDAEGTTLG
jgi:sterol desaturase/sphingolipid hydroxylase (fatty acid hydroxylase superfamily)